MTGIFKSMTLTKLLSIKNLLHHACEELDKFNVILRKYTPFHRNHYISKNFHLFTYSLAMLSNHLTLNQQRTG